MGVLKVCIDGADYVITAVALMIAVDILYQFVMKITFDSIVLETDLSTAFYSFKPSFDKYLIAKKIITTIWYTSIKHIF